VSIVTALESVNSDTSEHSRAVESALHHGDVEMMVQVR
jgi:hypothetical protein